MNYLNELGVLALGTRLRRLSDMIMTDGATMYKEANVDFDPKWFPVFSLLAKTSPLGIVEMADMLQISHPYVIQLVRALEKKGYIKNVASTADGRKRSIELSVKGRKLLKQLQPLWSDITNTLESTLRETNNDLYSDIINLESALSEQSFSKRIALTRKRRQQKAVRILPFGSKYKDYFKTLNIEWLEKYFAVEPIDTRVLSNPEQYIIEPGGAILFAEYEDDIVGTCALKKFENNSYELTKMAVTEKVQGLQIGKKLGQAIIQLANDKKADLIFLESNRKLIPAIKLYRTLGFVEKIRPFNSEYERSDIYMEMKLT